MDQVPNKQTIFLTIFLGKQTKSKKMKNQIQISLH